MENDELIDELIKAANVLADRTTYIKINNSVFENIKTMCTANIINVLESGASCYLGDNKITLDNTLPDNVIMVKRPGESNFKTIDLKV